MASPNYINEEGSLAFYDINEIFYSLQGEGTYTGHPMVFVRFYGCNLDCPWCDTKLKENDYTSLKAWEIVEKIKETLPPNYKDMSLVVCLTGGEPCLQVDKDLITALRLQGWAIHLETNGTRPIVNAHLFHRITISPKLPFGAIEDEELDAFYDRLFRHGGLSRRIVDLKVVLAASPEKKNKYEDTNNIILSWIQFPFAEYFIQPQMNEDGTSNIEDAIAFVKKTRPNEKESFWKLSQQTHKILGIR